MPSRADDDNDVNRFKEVMVVRPNLDCEWIFCCNFDGPASEDASTPSRPGQSAWTGLSEIRPRGFERSLPRASNVADHGQGMEFHCLPAH